MHTNLKKDLENGGSVTRSELGLEGNGGGRKMPVGGLAGEVEKERRWWIGGTDAFS